MSLAAFLLTISASVLRQGGSIFAGLEFGADAIISISLPVMIVFGLSPFVNIASQIIVPIASAASKIDEKAKLYELTIIAAKYSIFFQFYSQRFFFMVINLYQCGLA